MLYGLGAAAGLFKVLSGKNRLRILFLLSKRELCVCELSYVLNITQPAVSRHLKIMKKAGLIISEKSGFWTNYRLRKDDPLTAVLLRQLAPGLRADPAAKADRRRLAKANRATLCGT